MAPRLRCSCDLFRYEGTDSSSPSRWRCYCGHYAPNHEGGRYACNGKMVRAEKWKHWTRKFVERIRRNELDSSR